MKPFSSKEALGLAVLALMCVAALSVGYCSRSGDLGTTSGRNADGEGVLPSSEAVTPEAAHSDSMSVAGESKSRKSGAIKERKAKKRSGGRNKSKKHPAPAPSRRDPFADDVTTR